MKWCYTSLKQAFSQIGIASNVKNVKDCVINFGGLFL